MRNERQRRCGHEQQTRHSGLRPAYPLPKWHLSNETTASGRLAPAVAPPLPLLDFRFRRSGRGGRLCAALRTAAVSHTTNSNLCGSTSSVKRAKNNVITGGTGEVSEKNFFVRAGPRHLPRPPSSLPVSKRRGISREARRDQVSTLLVLASHPCRGFVDAHDSGPPQQGSRDAEELPLA